MALKAESRPKVTNKCDTTRCTDDAASPRAVASAEVKLPHAPKIGEYHRMENSDSTQRFKNRMRLQVFYDIAIFESGTGKRKKGPCRATLKKETEHPCIIEWREVNSEWRSATLEYHVRDGVEGMLEGGEHFWKLFKPYSDSDVADHCWSQELASPSPQPADAEPQLAHTLDASAAASAATPGVAASDSREEEEEEEVVFTSSSPQRLSGPAAWLGKAKSKSNKVCTDA